MLRIRTVLATVVLACACVLAGPPGWAEGAPPAGATDVHGDDEADRYVGTGGLVLPGTIGSGLRVEVASCLGCQWRLTSPCLQSDDGNPFSGTPVCLSVVRGCPNMAELLRGWFQPPDGAWRELGLVCIDQAGPVTVANAGAQVRDWLAVHVPAQRQSLQPARGVVTQLPVVFDSGQEVRGLQANAELLGQPVELDARPAWRWEFGDGSSLATLDPGGAYPNMGVTHTYRVAGDYRVQLSTTWTAAFTVDGLGPYSIAEPVRQMSSLRVSIGEGRAVLATR